MTRFDNIFNVKEFGAVGDGVTDDSAAILRAYAAVKVAGGAVYFPTGDYYTGRMNPISAAIAAMEDRHD
jgi:polygalacturonase